MGLQYLLGARAFQTFMDAHWPEQSFVSHGHDREVSALRDIAPLQSPERLFGQWPATGTAWSPREQQQPARELTAGELLSAYGTGHTIYLTRVERHLPELMPWIRGVERDLGLRRGDVSCEAICSLAGQGAKPHFDPNMTLNVQLLGRKSWKVAPNNSIVNPDVGGVLGGRVSSELRPLLTSPFPAEMPADASTFETAAGSVVFLPQGCWHATECVVSSMALLFTVAGNYWYSVLGREVEQQLRRHAVCRETALIQPPGVHAREDSRRQLAESLEILQASVAGLDADALLRKWSGPPMTTFRRTHVAAETPDDAEFLAWVETQGGVFHSADAVDAFAGTAPEEMLRRIWALESSGLLKAE
jgi:50S ribosomal protein L16 3-hydroxylase